MRANKESSNSINGEMRSDNCQQGNNRPCAIVLGFAKALIEVNGSICTYYVREWKNKEGETAKRLNYEVICKMHSCIKQAAKPSASQEM